MVRTEIDVNGNRYVLAQGEDPDELKQRMAAAAGAGSGFVDFTVAGNRVVSVLVSSALRVLFSSEIVELDPRDDEAPYERHLAIV
ncbi:hypothetical protein [Microbacterium sp.]|uniref:hypothetical protein n=1 Tax=Microbacterium sp. TaxID=51671 RepID=UPI002810BE3A|nr:hypothetical protein [Microbacterium sp.]